MEGYLEMFINTTVPIKGKDKPLEGTIIRQSGSALIAFDKALPSIKIENSPEAEALGAYFHYNEYYKRYGKLLKNKLFVADSGGFSVIQGHIPYHKIEKFNLVYNELVKIVATKASNIISHLLSLDIPFFLNTKEYSKQEIIHDLNCSSVKSLMYLIEEFPILRSKVMFVHQWKTPILKYIWDDIYDRHKVGQYVRHHAIGGLVGIISKSDLPSHGIVSFIGPSYQILYRIFTSDAYQDDGYHIIHILGVSKLYDRFFIKFFQRLFSIYLQKEIKFTYDSVQFFTGSMYLKNTVDPDIEKKVRKLIKFSHERFESVYQTQDEKDIYEENLKLFSMKTYKNQANLSNVHFIAPLYIRINLEMDDAMEKFIIDNELVEYFIKFSNSGGVSTFKLMFEDKISDLITSIYGESKHIEKRINGSFDVIYEFHNLWVNKRSKNGLDQLMDKFISAVNVDESFLFS